MNAREYQPGSGPTELVIRPEPGLARGVWAAPRWSFFAFGVVVLVAAGLYVAMQLGWIRRFRK